MSNPLQKFAAAAALATTLTAPAAAGPIFYDLTVTGRINGSTNIFTGNPGTVIPTYAANGTDVSFVFRYDINAADTNPSAQVGEFGQPLTSQMISSGLNINKNSTVINAGRIAQEAVGPLTYFSISSGAYTTGLPTGIGRIETTFFAQDGSDIGSLFNDVNDLSNTLNGLSNTDLFSMSINFTGNGRGGVPFFIEEAQLSNIRYAFNQVVIDEPPVGNVPEPASLALVGLGLGAVALARRRRENEAPAENAPAAKL